MDGEDFKSGIRICEKRWYPLKDPQKDIYFDLLKDIPAEAFNDICRDFISTYRTWPVPQDFLNQWVHWKSVHPERMAPAEKTPCKICFGSGFLEYWRFIEDLNDWYLYRCRCGYCDNWQESCPNSMERLTINQISQNDSMSLVLAPSPGDDKPKFRDFGELVSKIKDVPGSKGKHSQEELREQVESLKIDESEISDEPPMPGEDSGLEDLPF